MGHEDDARPPLSSSPSRNGFVQTNNENSEKNSSIFGRRRQRGGFSDSFATNDLGSLEIEDAATDEPSHSRAQEGTSTNLPSETDFSNASTSACEDESSEPIAEAAHWRGFFNLLKKGPQEHWKGLHPWLSVPRLTRRKSKRIREEMVPDHSPTLKSSFDGEICFKSSWKNFSIEDLNSATNNFSQENLIGEGGYAEVYKGELKDGQHVAIKRLTRGSQEEMICDFLSELGVIVHVNHPNIAKLIGYGVEGGMHLVLQLSPHGSLSTILYGPRESLDWNLRYKIAMGTATGLQYLHEGCQRRIIHRDIKAANILLSQDFEPQISDFGLSKWLPEQWTHHVVSNFEGTFGYLPPEFFMHGIVDEKTDVYAYGVLLLELLTGKPALDSSQRSLVMWAKPLLNNNNMRELVDPCLSNAYDESELDRIALTASMCISQTSAERPPMSEVVHILKADGSELDELRDRQKSKLQRTYSEELLDADDYNSTKFLNELNQQTDSVLKHCTSTKGAETEKTEASDSSIDVAISN